MNLIKESPFLPLFIGIILALIINIPMGLIEHRAFSKKLLIPRARRPMAILLSLALIFGLLFGIAFLIIPELIHAVTIIVQNIKLSLDMLETVHSSSELSSLPYGEYLAYIDIDLKTLRAALENISMPEGGDMIRKLLDAAGSAAGILVDILIGLVFAVYILANKEKLKGQVLRLIHVWLPEKFGACLIHVAFVCIATFRLFMIGQMTEAVILGSLCTIGMLILGLPYAPVIGVLVGVTALLPIVGAYIGAVVGAFMIFMKNPFQSLVFLIFLLILQQLEGNLIYPRVVGSKLHLPAMWVLAAIVVGGNIGGPVGMLVGVPAAASAYTLLKEATEKREHLPSDFF